MSAAPIRRLLVANRGEIAARILRTARAQGIECAIVRHAAEDAVALGGGKVFEGRLEQDVEEEARACEGAR